MSVEKTGSQTGLPSLLRAPWGGALEATRVVLLDLALATDEQLLWAFA